MCKVVPTYIFSDSWWIAATVFLFYNPKTRYDLPIRQIILISPRFAVTLTAMLLSICFIIVDVLSLISALKSALPVGTNPFWKLNFVFKCLTDSVLLDDFKTALDRLRAFKLSRLSQSTHQTVAAKHKWTRLSTRISGRSQPTMQIL
jgi:hypothetical protein